MREGDYAFIAAARWRSTYCRMPPWSDVLDLLRRVDARDHRERLVAGADGQPLLRASTPRGDAVDLE